MKLDAKVIDIDRVYATVSGLSDIDKDKAVKAGLRAASYVFLSGGRQRLRQRMKNPNGYTGNLLNSFQVRIKRVKLGALVGFGRVQDVGFDKRGGKGYHAHLVDLGTGLRQTKWHDTGVMPGNLFWTDTVNMDSGKALEKLYQALERAVVKLENRR